MVRIKLSDFSSGGFAFGPAVGGTVGSPYGPTALPVGAAFASCYMTTILTQSSGTIPNGVTINVENNFYSAFGGGDINAGQPIPLVGGIFTDRDVNTTLDTGWLSYWNFIRGQANQHSTRANAGTTIIGGGEASYVLNDIWWDLYPAGETPAPGFPGGPPLPGGGNSGRLLWFDLLVNGIKSARNDAS